MCEPNAHGLALNTQSQTLTTVLYRVTNVPENEQRNPQTITKKLKYEKEKNRSNTGTYAIFKTLLRGGGEGRTHSSLKK